MNFKKYRRLSAYNAEKTNKMQNFALINETYCKKGQTVLLGDSITEMFNHTELFSAYTEQTGIAVYNRGISGDTGDRLLERLDVNLFNLAPRNVVLLIGTNDLSKGADVDYVFSNIQKIAAEIKAHTGANLILEGVLPVNRQHTAAYKKKNAAVRALNGRLCTLAAECGAGYFDLTERLSGTDGALRSDFTYDGLHINAKAYEITANAILPLLK